jgi:hypothetical protein
VFLEAALAGKNIKLGGNFHHARTSSLAGYSSGWGVSPLIPALKNYMYIAVLRRASEAIGMEHITPQRILFPQMSGTTDPSLLGSMERWREEVTTAVNKWRVDPNFVATAPFPTGVVNIGSQGRALIPTEEIKDARMEMALALDINPALLTGDMTIQGSAVSLRILEHQLMPLIESLEAFTNWVISSINTKYEKDFSQVTLVPFKLADDLMNKQLLFQSLSLGSVSRRTVQESLSLDAEQERERIFQEQLADHKMQKDVEGAIAKEERNIAAQAKAEEQAAETGGITPYNQQKLIAQAQQIAAQFLGVPYEQRRSMLDQLQNEDYVMWALVSKQLEGMREHQQRQA